MPRELRIRYGIKSGETFQLFNGDSSLSNLPQNLTINGQTVAPTFIYEGKNATTSAWTATVGSDLSIAGSGDDPTVGVSTPLTDNTDECVSFAGAKYFSVAGADWATEDGVLGIVFQASGTTNATILFHNDGTHGYRVYVNGSDQLVFEAAGADSTVSVTSAALVSGAWYFAELYFDASGSAQWYINSSASGSAADVSGTGSLTASTNLLIGSDGTNGYDSDIAQVGLNLQASWLDTHLQAALAKERFIRLCGFYPQLAKGTAVPTTAARNSVAYVDRVGFGNVTELHSVGANWPRLCERRDAQVDKDEDYVSSNGFETSEDFTTSNWNKVASAIETSTGVTYRGREVQGIVGAATDAAHGLSTALNPATPHRHIFVGAFKAGARGAVRLSSTDLASNSVWAQFKLDGSATTASLTGGSVQCEAEITELEDGFYLCCMSYEGGDFDHTHLILPIDDATVDDATYTGDGSTVDLHVAWLNHDYSTSATGRTHLLGGYKTGYVKTSGVARTLGARVTGYLAEEARINQQQNSEDLTSSTPGNVTFTPGGVKGIAPDGIQSAEVVHEDGTAAASHNFYETWGNPTASTDYTASAFVKAINRSKVRIEMSGGIGEYADFDVSAGTVLAESAGAAASIEDWGNDWYRCIVTADGSGGGSTQRIWVLDDSGNSSFDGQDQDSFYVWGRQVEQGSFASSYIQTTGIDATRVKDELTYVAGDNIGGEDPTGLTVYTECLPDYNDSAFGQYVWTISDGGGATDRIHGLIWNNSKWGVFCISSDGDNGDTTAAGTTAVVDQAIQLTMTLLDNDLVHYVDGVSDGTDTSVDIPDDLDRLDIGQTQGGGGQFNGLISNIRIFKRSLPNKVILASWE
jgi:hypothetical protein